MRTRAALLLVVLSALRPNGLIAGERRSPLLSEMEREFAGKTFVTRLILGNTWRYYNDRARREFMRRVDTEVYPDGDIKYLCRRGDIDLEGRPLLSGLLDGNFYVKPEKMIAVPEGREVRVEKVEMMDDRLELHLAVLPGRIPAKLKFMFGKGFQEGATYDSIMSSIATSLRLVIYERVRRLDAEHAELERKLSAARATYQAAAEASLERFKAAEALRASLAEGERNRSAVELLGRPSGEATARYAREGAELDRAISALREVALKERKGQIAQVLKTEAAELEQLRKRLQAKPAQLQEWREQQGTLVRCEALLDRRQALFEERATTGVPASAEELGHLEQDRRQIQKARSTLDAQHQVFERARLDEAYQQMERKLPGAEDVYTRAFHTAQQDAETAKLLAMLEEMHANRIAAQKVGAVGAEAQATALLQKIERTRHHRHQ